MFIASPTSNKLLDWDQLRQSQQKLVPQAIHRNSGMSCAPQSNLSKYKFGQVAEMP